PERELGFSSQAKADAWSWSGVEMARRYDPVELEDLKARTPLSDLFDRYGVRGKGRGPQKWAGCCFHGGKTGSLHIDDKKGRFHCFGCGAAGDHFDVLRQLGGKSFSEAVEVLGGVRLITAEERKATEERYKQYEDEEKKERERNRKAVERIF